MTYRKFLFVAVLVPVLAAGCARPAARSDPPPTGTRTAPPAGGQSAPAAGQSPPAVGQSPPAAAGPGARTSPPGQPAPAGSGEPPPLPEAGQFGNGSAPWTLLRRGPRDTDLVLTVAGLACRPVVGAHLTETAQAVTIAVVLGRTPLGRCVDVDRTATVLVRAAAPIGSREIRHAPLVG